MGTDAETVQEVAVEQAESAVEGGESTTVESTNTSGESEGKATSKGEPGAEGLFDGMDGATLHKSYKSIQSEYTKAQEMLKKSQKYGGVDQLVQWADYLAENQDFAKWVQEQQNRKLLGAKGDEAIDEDQQKALDTVRKIAQAEAERNRQELYKSEIAPIAEAYKQQMLEKHFTDMDAKHGKDWNEVRDVMAELSDELPKSVQDRPTFDVIEDLYFKALRKTGKLEAYAERVYAKKLAEKKAKATTKPAPAPQEGMKPAATIREAFEMAKRAHNYG